MIRRLLMLALLALPLAAQAQPLRVMESAQSIMDGNRQEFLVRFDAPVDHNRSRLEVLRNGQLVRALQPRLVARLDTLNANAGSLPPGDYVLRWVAVRSGAGETSEGTLPFTVRP